jgi:hypothetical protein
MDGIRGASVNLATTVERWRRYWNTVTDPTEVEGQLRRLRWLEEFVFHCGPEIQTDDYRALRQQIEAGERKLAELQGDFTGGDSSSGKPEVEVVETR